MVSENDITSSRQQDRIVYLDRIDSEALILSQVAPLSWRQLTQPHATDANPLQPGHFESDQFAHASDLALAAFREDEAQLIGVLPADSRRAQFTPVER